MAAPAPPMASLRSMARRSFGLRIGGQGVGRSWCLRAWWNLLLRWVLLRRSVLADVRYSPWIAMNHRRNATVTLTAAKESSGPDRSARQFARRRIRPCRCGRSARTSRVVRTRTATRCGSATSISPRTPRGVARTNCSGVRASPRRRGLDPRHARRAADAARAGRARRRIGGGGARRGRGDPERAGPIDPRRGRSRAGRGAKPGVFKRLFGRKR